MGSWTTEGLITSLPVFPETGSDLLSPPKGLRTSSRHDWSLALALNGCIQGGGLGRWALGSTSSNYATALGQLYAGAMHKETLIPAGFWFILYF